MIEPAVARLLAYGKDTGILRSEDIPYVRNRILNVLRISSYDLAAELTTVPADGEPGDIDDLLRPLLDHAARSGLIDPDTQNQRDLWDTPIMDSFLGQPSAVSADFWRRYRVGPREATDAFHSLCVAANYVRASRADASPRWIHPSRYGDFEISINTAKPEKDPRDIAAAARHVAGSYPTCMLCRENEGYAGNASHPARENLRLIPMQLDGENWYFQYSPYRYYNEHCIVLSEYHRPMSISDATFPRMADFVETLPHYLIGSNADLPIVGGSILTHDHFQGGRHVFPMERAGVAARIATRGVVVEILNWPLAVIRLRGGRQPVIAAAAQILAGWRQYSDPDRGVLANSGGCPHNTITPILRMEGAGEYRCDLALRNNRTSAEHPLGIFHPHAEIHPIKKENIGLIEVMGLAILPGRLEQELAGVATALVSGEALPAGLAHHAPMLASMRSGLAVHGSPDEALALTRRWAADYFVRGLEQCGVFGSDQVEGCLDFLVAIGWDMSGLAAIRSETGQSATAPVSPSAP